MESKEPLKVRVTVRYGEAFIDMEDADIIAGIARKDGQNTILTAGSLPMDAYMGFIVDLMGVVNQMVAGLPPENQNMIVNYVAQQAGVQISSGRQRSRGIFLPPKPTLLH